MAKEKSATPKATPKTPDQPAEPRPWQPARSASPADLGLGPNRPLPKAKAGPTDASRLLTAHLKAQEPHARARKDPRGRKRKPLAWVPDYLARLSIHRQKTKAAAEAGVDPSTVWDLRNKDPDFVAAEKKAMAIALDKLEDEVHRRGVEGVPKYSFDSRGQLSKIETVYSDTLLLRLLVRAETGSWKDQTKQEIADPKDDFTKMTRAERLAKLAEAEAATKKPL